jgi:hypothetical protein
MGHEEVLRAARPSICLLLYCTGIEGRGSDREVKMKGQWGTEPCSCVPSVAPVSCDS